MSNGQDEFEEVGSLWPAKSGKGLSGTIKPGVELKGGERIFLQENKYATPENRQPTHRIKRVKQDAKPVEPLKPAPSEDPDDILPF
ncbi:MAG TPA: hypothetical protein VEA41_17910 [Salinarimonas sp.]|nr:hypothetical protein [Salinarimonas sp.]